jgi:hypothetical protein
MLEERQNRFMKKERSRRKERTREKDGSHIIAACCRNCFLLIGGVLQRWTSISN